MPDEIDPVATSDGAAPVWGSVVISFPAARLLVVAQRDPNFVASVAITKAFVNLFAKFKHHNEAQGQIGVMNLERDGKFFVLGLECSDDPRGKSYVPSWNGSASGKNPSSGWDCPTAAPFSR